MQHPLIAHVRYRAGLHANIHSKPQKNTEKGEDLIPEAGNRNSA
jgi:hypothetical protein